MVTFDVERDDLLVAKDTAPHRPAAKKGAAKGSLN